MLSVTFKLECMPQRKDLVTDDSRAFDLAREGCLDKYYLGRDQKELE
jgi:hypothetical protein